ncbi:aspartic peptidase domain-containing protein [Hysterangium stoloniferum]|nr:aspartic peptidase domain-containing protein [Hysterangium stoloniferum]
MLRAFMILTLSSGYCFAASVQAKHGFTATLPITKRTGPSLGRRQKTAAIGLGDNSDVLYSVEIQVGDTLVPLQLDTGEADLWAISTDCLTCSATTPQISTSSFNPSGLDIEFDFGDSTHPTFAIGSIVSGPVSISGMQVQNQFIGAINSTNSPVVDDGISGFFGAGFPTNSFILTKLLPKELPAQFTGPQLTDKFISIMSTQAPLLSRLALDGQLAQPMFTVTLQRETIEMGGNVGELTIGKLPEGVSNNSLTWVPVRLYTEAQGGISGPSNNPNERFPANWEVTLDDVFLNGQKLPQPVLPEGTGYTALIDTASFCTFSDIIISTDGVNPPTFLCNTPVDLTFIIGGKPFPVDPRDFLGQQVSLDSPPDCTTEATLLITDPPASGALFSWILGTVFLKSTLVAFYFGNLANPAADPPRIGFLSTVPSTANAALLSDVQSASAAHDGFLITSVSAPLGTFTATATNSLGVAQAPTSGKSVPTFPGSNFPGTTFTVPPPFPSIASDALRIQTPWVFLVSLLFCVQLL